MIPEKIHNIMIPFAVLGGGVGLSLFVDSHLLMYTLIGVSVLTAVGYAVLAFRRVLETNITLHHAAVAFFLWSTSAAIFGLRSLQVSSLPVVLLAGLALSLITGFCWVRNTDSHKALWHLIALITFEWFCILLFAPGGFMVLAALLTVGVTTTATLFEKKSEDLSRRVVTQSLVTALAISALFIFGFRWVL